MEFIHKQGFRLPKILSKERLASKNEFTGVKEGIHKIPDIENKMTQFPSSTLSFDIPDTYKSSSVLSIQPHGLSKLNNVNRSNLNLKESNSVIVSNSPRSKTITKVDSQVYPNANNIETPEL